jgi:hypothetical protein
VIANIKKNGTFSFCKLFSFKEFLTPKVITVLFWIAAIYIIVSGVLLMLAPFNGFNFMLFLGGISYIFIGLISLRVSCELILVIFRILDKLTIIANK